MNFKLLKDKNFFILIVGRALSLIGNLLLTFVLSLYILDQTGSGVMFASVLALSGLTSLVLTPISGVFSDWFDKRKMMIWLDFLAGVFVLYFYFIARFYPLELHHVYIIVVVLTALNAVDAPIVQTSISGLVDNENLASANSIKILIQTLSQIISPIIGGLLFGATKISLVLLITAILFITTSIIEIFMKIPNIKKVKTQKWYVEFISDFKEGLQYVTKQKVIIFIIITAIFANLTSPIITIGIPYIVQLNLELGSFEFGISQTMFVIGVLLGTIIATKVITKIGLLTLLTTVIILFCGLISMTGLVILPFTLQIIGSQIAFIIICMTMISSGIILTILNIAVSTSIQIKTPPQMLGRVLSVVITLSMALTPIGQLIYGLAFDSINSSIIIFVSTLILITIGLICKMIIIKNPELSVANPKS